MTGRSRLDFIIMRAPARGRTGVAFAVLVFMLVGADLSAAEPAVPPGVTEIEAPRPLEISGVAAVPGGYAAVGDDTADHGRLWPGGGHLKVDPKVEDMESIDVGFAPGGLGQNLELLRNGQDRESRAAFGAEVVCA